MPTKRVVARPRRKSSQIMLVGIATAAVLFAAGGVAFANFGLTTSEESNDPTENGNHMNDSPPSLTNIANYEDIMNDLETDTIIPEAQETAAAETDTTQVSATSESESADQAKATSSSSYIGYYKKEYEIGWAEYDASYQVSIESIDGDTAIVSLCRTYPNGAHFDAVHSIPATVNGNVLSFSYDEDDQLSSGYGTIELYDGHIVVDVTETYHAPNIGASLMTDPPITIYKVSDMPMSL